MSVRSPDAIEPLELWRSWRYEGGRLLSVYKNDEWAPDKPFEATCAYAEHQGPLVDNGEHGTVPAEDCSCGIYALYDPRRLPEGEVYGKVKVWGEVIRGSHGARAQYAYPSELHVPQWLGDREALRAYGVPIFVDASPAPPEPEKEPPGLVIPTLSQLGLSEAMGEQITRVITGPTGALLVTGRADSGKSTTLLACVSIAAALRSEADVVIVDEMIRDGETAKITLETALSGHLVLSTLHANDAPEAITRLSAMGVEPLLMGLTVKGVLAQRLAQKLCSYCCEMYTPSIDELIAAKVSPEFAAAKEGIVFYRKRGCPSCDQTGYRGRIGIFQVLGMNDELETLVTANAPREEIERAAEADGMRSLWDDGLSKVAAGLTSTEELARVIGF